MTHVSRKAAKRRRNHGSTRIVHAAGVVPWRETRAGDLEVLLVHRPKYDDWSWPKGKAEAGETPPETAVREAREETGLAFALGRPLPPREYVIGSGDTKCVDYWCAHDTGDAEPAPEDRHEIDVAEWMVPDQAHQRLTYARDRDLLVDFLGLGDDRGTRTLVIVRHAKSTARSSWGSRPDAERPLSDRGRKQARGLVGLLACWRPDRVLTSPSVRCHDTVGPFAEATGTPFTEDKWLSEEGFAENPDEAREIVRRLVAGTWVGDGETPGSATVVLCTHRPLFPAVVAELSAAVPDGADVGLPDGDPYLTKAQALVVQLAPGPEGPVPGPRIVSAEVWKPKKVH